MQRAWGEGAVALTRLGLRTRQEGVHSGRVWTLIQWNLFTKALG